MSGAVRVMTLLPIVSLSQTEPSSRTWRFWLRCALVAAPVLLAIGILHATEYGPFATTLSLATFAFLTGLGILVFRRPGIATGIALLAIAILISLSKLKFDIVQLTLTFLDFLMIDPDTASFLATTFPTLRVQLLLGATAIVPALALLWWLDPFRIRRPVAAAITAASLAVMTGMSLLVPEQPWEPFQGVNHISNLSRSGVAAVSHLAENGWIEADSGSLTRAAYAAPLDACDTTVKRPHVIMLLDESSFDITAVPGIKVPANYANFFRSADGKQRTFMPEATGGPTWYTEFNVLMGLSARSFGKMRYYVTRIAAGRISRGLPQALKRCGYRTFTLYPSYGNFLSARSFQHSAGVGGFVDAADMKAPDEQQPDSFYFNQALKLIDREKAEQAPLFTFVYLAANHFPWTSTFRADLTPEWEGLGNTPEVDEYIRRQMMTVKAYEEFTAQLKARYPDESFVIVRFGDHQPAISQKLIEPDLPQSELAKRVMNFDPRYFSTYYAIDAINYDLPKLPSALKTLDAAYLPIVVQEAARVPLDPSFTEQRKIMLRCGGEFYGCRDGAEARRFNRLLIDAGLIKGL